MSAISDAKARWEAPLHDLARQTFAASDDGAHDLAHVLRVWRNCQDIEAGELAKGNACDCEVLIASAFLHDMVSLPKNDPNRHLSSIAAAKQALLSLQDLSFPKAKFDGVRHAIEAHSFSANIAACSPEAMILQDADRLDALGAIGIARTFYVGGKMASELFHSTDPQGDNREADDKRFAFDHFKTKLFVIADTMKTRTGKKLAEQRIQFMQQFCDQLLDEARA